MGRRGSKYALNDLVEELDGFLYESIGDERPILVGHSLGTSLALQYMTDHPNRCLGVVAADIGMPTGSGVSLSSMQDMQQLIPGSKLEVIEGAGHRRLLARHPRGRGATSEVQDPVKLDTVRSFRANMLYDTLAVRIHPELDPLREIWRFLRNYERNLDRGVPCHSSQVWSTG